MTAKDPKKSEAAIVRWDPDKRHAKVMRQLLAVISAYRRDHPDRAYFSQEEAYLILDALGYRTQHPSSFARKELDIDMDAEILH